MSIITFPTFIFMFKCGINILWYICDSVFIRILEDDLEECVSTPKTQMLAINVWPTTHKVKKSKRSLQQLCICCRAEGEDECSKLEPSNSSVHSPQHKTVQHSCQEKLFGSQETTGPANWDLKGKCATPVWFCLLMLGYILSNLCSLLLLKLGVPMFLKSSAPTPIKHN